jgi:serine/threonine protein kinase
MNTGKISLEQQLQPGVTLGNRYLIQTVVGVGGMGAVYKARDLHFPNVNKRVAVKEMINTVRDPAMRETMVKNFEREANLLATLEHPAIPRIYDYFTQNERSYLILEFVEGKDLEALMAETQGQFPEERVVGWAIELCDVLTYLHSHQPEPIIFRDIKPSNIMIDLRGHVVLVDFGIAKTFNTGQKGTMIGTEGYSPPEQYKGEAGPLSDIYSLGATLHHLVTRRDPRLEAPFSFGERPARQINPAVSIELETVINTALQYNPQNRFPSTDAMKEALMGVARKTGMLSLIRNKSEGLRMVEDASKLAWKFEAEDEIRGTPLVHDGTVYFGSYDTNLYAIKALDGEFVWKYPTDGGIVAKPAFYDGNLYFGSEDRRLHVVSQRSGKVVWTYFADGAIRSSPVITEDHVFFGADDGCLHAVSTMTGRRAWKIDSGGHIRSTPLISGERIFFGNEAGDFYCLDLSGNIKWKFKTKRAITSSPILGNNLVIFGSVDSTVYALDAKTGFVLWRFRLTKPTIASPVLVENFVLIGSTDYNMYCIDATSAKEVWRFPAQHQVTGSALIIRDSVIFGSVDKFVYCLEYRNGRMRWKYQTDGPITGAPAAWQDSIFIGSTDHRIYALTV